MTTLINRGQLFREMRSDVARNADLAVLQRAVDLLHPAGRRPDVAEIALAVLYRALRSHEDHTQAVLTRMNGALARTMDDLEAMVRGRPIAGRTAGMQADDLAVVAQAMDDLATLDDRVRQLLASDADGSWRRDLQLEAESAMAARAGAAAEPAADPATTAVAMGTRRIPATADEAVDGLRQAIWAVAPTGRGIWAGRRLPPSIAAAAHDVVVMAGGDMRAAVQRLLRTGGEAADDLVIAVLWAEGRIGPYTHNLGGAPHDVHQRVVTGLPYEWSALRSSATASAPVARVRDFGIDGIRGGTVIDAKHVAGDFAASAHLLGGAEATSRRRQAMFRPTPDGEPPSYPGTSELGPYDAVDELADLTGTVSPTRRAEVETALWEQELEMVAQMQRQLDFARENGLHGIRWVTNSAEMAAYLQRLMDNLPNDYRNLRREAVVGGLGVHR